VAITQREEYRQDEDGSVLLKVAGGSEGKKVAGAIAKYLNEGAEVSLIAIGAGAVNQMVKSVCIARSMVAARGWNLKIIPGFVDEAVQGVPKTAIRFYLEK
jgi:stage V sporulation protein SpoVS